MSSKLLLIKTRCFWNNCQNKSSPLRKVFQCSIPQNSSRKSSNIDLQKYYYCQAFFKNELLDTNPFFLFREQPMSFVAPRASKRLQASKRRSISKRLRASRRLKPTKRIKAWKRPKASQRLKAPKRTKAPKPRFMACHACWCVAWSLGRALCALKFDHVLRFLRLCGFVALRSASEGMPASGFVASRLCGVVKVKRLRGFVAWSLRRPLFPIRCRFLFHDRLQRNHWEPRI